MPDPLDTSVPVPADRAPLFEFLCDNLPGGGQIREDMHERELESAAQPPVINVTMTDPRGVPMPGHWELVPGQADPVWRPDPAPDLTQTRPLHVTREARRQS